jgi:large subunit ribosomal protein L31
MKEGIHPATSMIKVTCSCGNTFSTLSTLKHELHIDVCSACHPVYTKKQKQMDSGGQVERFRKRWGLKKSSTSTSKEASGDAGSAGEKA